MDISELDIDFLSQKLSDDPQSPLFARLADLYLMKNQAEEALRLCEAGMKNYPAYTSAFIVLGKCRLALKERAKARRAFQTAIQLSPFNQVAKSYFAEIPEDATDEVRAIEDEFITAAVPKQDASEISQPLHEEKRISASEDFQTAQAENEQAPEAVSQEVQPAFPSLEEYLQQKLNSKEVTPSISLDEYLGISVSVKPNQIEALAEQLQNARSIVPQAENVPGDDVSMSETSSDETASTNIVTPTLAEIYASQGKYSAAIQAYEILILSKPEEREKFEKRIKELQAKLYESEGLV